MLLDSYHSENSKVYYSYISNKLSIQTYKR